MFDFFEFFAGGGMVRSSLGAKWRCRFANDFDPQEGVIAESVPNPTLSGIEERRARISQRPKAVWSGSVGQT